MSFSRVRYWGLRVKSACYLCGGPKVSSQYLCYGCELATTTVSGDLMPSLTYVGTTHANGKPICMLAKHSLTNIK